MRFVSGLCLALLLGSGAVPAFSAETILAPEDKPFRVEGELEAPGKDDPEAAGAYDISGIACLLRGSGKRRCLVVNDEGRKAQFVTIDDRSIEPKATLDLIGKEPDVATRGRLPTESHCPDGSKPKFKEFDGEGVAYAAPYFYVVGSHGCGRKSGKLKTSSLILARIPVDGDGKQAEAVETTYRLGEVLAGAKTVGPSFLHGLNEANGLNVEGVAVVGDRLYAGLRAPSIGTQAFLVEAEVEALFAKGHEAYRGTSRTIPLKVGEGAGIRDLSALEDGRLLVLTGPAQEQPGVTYTLFLFDPAKGGDPQPLGSLAKLEGSDSAGKAEAVTVIGRDRVLVFFDSLKNGAPRAYKVPAALTSGR